MGNRRRVEKRYIQCHGFRFSVSTAEWGDYLRRGYAHRVSDRVARPAAGIEVIWEDDRHMLRDSNRPGVSIPSSWLMVLRAWFFNVEVVSASRVGESPLERQERVLFHAERERQNEALCWRTFRNTRGANEFVYISAESKAEQIGALRPDLAQV